MFKPTRVQRQILDVIGEPMTPTEIARTLGKKKAAVWMRCQVMVQRNLLVKVGHGRYWFARPEHHGAEVA